MRPSQAAAALSFAKTLGAVLRPELPMVESHLKASDSGFENGHGGSSYPPHPKHPHGVSPTDLIFELSKPWFPHLGFEPKLFRLVGSDTKLTWDTLTVTPGS